MSFSLALLLVSWIYSIEDEQEICTFIMALCHDNLASYPGRSHVFNVSLLRTFIGEPGDEANDNYFVHRIHGIRQCFESSCMQPLLAIPDA